MMPSKLPKKLFKKVNKELEERKQRNSQASSKRLEEWRKRASEEKRKLGIRGAKRKATPMCPFSETPLGHFMIHNCPDAWRTLQATFKYKFNGLVPTNVIRNYAIESNNPVFKSQAFKYALKDYERYGRRTPNRVKLNREKEIAFIRGRISLRSSKAGVELLML